LARSGSRVNAFVEKAEKNLEVKDFAAAQTILREGLAAIPGNSELLHLAGRVAYHLGNFHESASLLRSAVAAAPGAETYCDLGLVHRAQGDLADSATCFHAAIRRDPNLHPAHLNLGFVLRTQGNLMGALEAFYAAFKLDPENIDCLLSLGGILGRAKTPGHEPLIEEMLVGVLEAAGADYQSLAPAAAHQLIKKYGVDDDGSSARCLDPEDPLLRLYLTQCLNIVPTLEYTLARHRRDLLLAQPNGLNATSSGMAVLIALQGFNNEYVMFSDPDENAAVAAKRDGIESALLSGERPEGFDADVLVVSMYQPLSTIAGGPDHVEAFEAVGWAGFEAVVQVTLKDRIEEQALKSAIAAFSPIEDETSQDVRGQYEENPYPRWLHMPPIMPFNLAHRLKAMFPHFSPRSFLEDPGTILVAGCGTGRHVARVALQWPRADVVAIDLSAASIAYAMRKTKQLRIENVRYLQGDILEAGRLDGPFDMVQSVGVLHHMKEPVEGWRVLAGLIRGGGVFRGGLYCERGRQGVFAARRAIADEGISSDRADIAHFRRRILSGEIAGDFSKLIELADFFSTSNCRDLMFHVHEDNYTPLRLKAEIENVGLAFLGFNEFEEQGINTAYRHHFPDDPSLTDLENWEEFEKSQEHPLEGYDFWCWKPS